MLTEIAWLMTKAYIILIFSAAVIRSEQILYDTSIYIFSEATRRMECMAVLC